MYFLGRDVKNPVENEDFERLAENERMVQQKMKYEKEQKKFKEALEKQQAMLEEKDAQIAYKELLKKGFTLE